MNKIITGRPKNEKAMEALKEMREKFGDKYNELSLRDKAALLSKTLHKKPHARQVARWDRYIDEEK